jgi:hypothetical protein
MSICYAAVVSDRANRVHGTIGIGLIIVGSTYVRLTVAARCPTEFRRIVWYDCTRVHVDLLC